MKQSLKIGAVTLAVAVVASSGLAFAQSSGDDESTSTPATVEQDGFRFRPALHLAREAAAFLGLENDELKEALGAGQTLAEVAEANGVSEADLVAYLVEDATGHINDAVESGKLTQEQADEMLAGLEDKVTGYVTSVHPVADGKPHPRLHGMREAVEFLGIDPQVFAGAVQDGQTLGEIAGANGSSQADLIDYLVADATDHINQGVADGRLTREQADEMLAGLEEKVTEFVTTSQPIRTGIKDRVAENRQEMVGIVTEFLGISTDELKAAFEAGTSLADLAAGQGVTVDELVDALAAPAEERLAEAVANGTITRDEADERIAMIRERVAERVENVPGERPVREAIRGRLADPSTDPAAVGVSTIA